MKSPSLWLWTTATQQVPLCVWTSHTKGTHTYCATLFISCRLSPVELSDYVAVTTSIAKALNILQVEAEVDMVQS